MQKIKVMSEGKKNRSNKPKGARLGKSIAKKTEFSSPQLKKNRPIAKTIIGKETDAIRLNKYISNSGLCTRKDADLYISTGSVRVNGKVITEMGYKVKPNDEVRFDGQVVTPFKKTYILLNKPKGFTLAATTTNEKKSVLALVQKASPNNLVKPVGKMERNTSGLVVLSNDDSFLGKLNSSGRMRQIFHVELNKNFAQVDFEKILEGIYIDNNVVKVHDLSYISDSKREIGIQLNSQKNRIVTRIFEKLGYTIERLDRVVFGGLTKKDLPRGDWRVLTKQELINLQMIS